VVKVVGMNCVMAELDVPGIRLLWVLGGGPFTRFSLDDADESNKGSSNPSCLCRHVCSRGKGLFA
jgi:hypothetical protein